LFEYTPEAYTAWQAQMSGVLFYGIIKHSMFISLSVEQSPVLRGRFALKSASLFKRRKATKRLSSFIRMVMVLVPPLVSYQKWWS